MEQKQLLQEITELSYSFGTPDYVCGGGGNTSAKNETTLWVKPSGTMLKDLKPDSFVALHRGKLAELYAIYPPRESSEREELVKEKMAAAVLPGSVGRASVEAPLHDSLRARFVVHTHPAIVNGMTCSKKGREVCGRLFPEALWLDYVDPGYTLCMAVRRRIEEFRDENGREPVLIFLKNHGVFIAGETKQEIRASYAALFVRLTSEYAQANVPAKLQISPLPAALNMEECRREIREAYEDETIQIAASGLFQVPLGPISPDHIVYAKSYPLIGDVSPETVSHYRKRYGYVPQILVWKGAVYGIGVTETKSFLALDLARDGALVQQLAGAFGGIEYMTDSARLFIENWEVETYRSRQIS